MYEVIFIFKILFYESLALTFILEKVTLFSVSNVNRIYTLLSLLDPDPVTQLNIFIPFSELRKYV